MAKMKEFSQSEQRAFIDGFLASRGMLFEELDQDQETQNFLKITAAIGLGLGPDRAVRIARAIDWEEDKDQAPVSCKKASKTEKEEDVNLLKRINKGLRDRLENVMRQNGTHFDYASMSIQKALIIFALLDIGCADWMYEALRKEKMYHNTGFDEESPEAKKADLISALLSNTQVNLAYDIWRKEIEKRKLTVRI